MAAGEINVPAVPGLPGQHVVGAPRPGCARQLQSDGMALLAQRTDQFVQRECPPLAARARGEADAIHERHM